MLERARTKLAPLRLFLHYIAGKNMWGKKTCNVGKEFGVVISPDLIFIFLPEIFLSTKSIGAVGLNRRSQSKRRRWSVFSLFSPFPPVRSFLLAANIACLNVRGQILRR
ncbi:hypothetical protein Pla52o_55620 [Novipirellula galeiformis]|uniref:Uncharacterized protein n=1 Tax=Novipirellula galeiformis TaxID=2528004 RepID=A0A5C6BSU4_9BACT|nr:hypothetical protein Pla52o_55620 [Novipirellula galeiformis]